MDVKDNKVFNHDVQELLHRKNIFTPTFSSSNEEKWWWKKRKVVLFQTALLIDACLMIDV